MKLQAGQVAVVTGAASGIGFALAEAFVGRGLQVVLSDVRQDRVGAAAQQLAEQGGTTLAVATDVRDADAVDSLARATLDRFGRVDVVCNNAGVVGPFAPMWEQPVAAWRWVIDVALLGVVHGIRSFVPHLAAQGSGHVVNTASMGGLAPLPGLAPYNAAKHAVVGISETLAMELGMHAPGVGVSVLCPGFVVTELATSSAENRPADLAVDATTTGPSTEEVARASGSTLTAADIAAITLAGIEAERLHIVTHLERAGDIKARLDSVLRDLEPL